MARLIYSKPQPRRFLPVLGTNLMMPVGPRLKKKPRFKALMVKVRQDTSGNALEGSQGSQINQEVGGEVKTLWVALSEHHVGHMINITEGGEAAVCGQLMASAKPYHGDKFCKKCLEAGKGD